MSIRPIMRDTLFLSQRALPATGEDLSVARDLLDTLAAHSHECVGMAANMIGVNKAIIAIRIGSANVAMLNPVIVRRSGPYTTQEGCLSLDGTRSCTRYQEIVVTYQDTNLRAQRQKFSGWTAEILQHEIDHLKGIII